MTLLHDAVDAKKMDVRVVERNIARGVLPVDTMKEAINKLPDDSENAEYVSVDQLASDTSAQKS